MSFQPNNEPITNTREVNEGDVLYVKNHPDRKHSPLELVTRCVSKRDRSRGCILEVKDINIYKGMPVNGTWEINQSNIEGEEIMYNVHIITKEKYPEYFL